MENDGLSCGTLSRILSAFDSNRGSASRINIFAVVLDPASLSVPTLMLRGQRPPAHAVWRYAIPKLIGHGCGSSKNINSAPTSAIFFVKLILSICFICASSTFQ